MVKDKNNEIYTKLLRHIQGLYPAVNGGTAFSEKTKLPFMHFTQLDGSTKLTTLSNTEDGINLAFQIDVYTNTGMNLARNIANDIRAYMISEGFRCRNFMPIDQPSNVSRFVGRYERLDV